MPDTYEQAAVLARPVLAAAWPADLGELVVAAAGYQDEGGFLVPYGSRASFEDDGLDSMVLDQPWCVVDRESGEVFLFAPLEALDRVHRMLPA